MYDAEDAVAYFLVQGDVPASCAQAAQDIGADTRRDEVVVSLSRRGWGRVAAPGVAFCWTAVWRHHVDALDYDGAGADVFFEVFGGSGEFGESVRECGDVVGAGRSGCARGTW